MCARGIKGRILGFFLVGRCSFWSSRGYKRIPTRWIGFDSKCRKTETCASAKEGSSGTNGSGRRGRCCGTRVCLLCCLLVQIIYINFSVCGTETIIQSIHNHIQVEIYTPSTHTIMSALQQHGNPGYNAQNKAEIALFRRTNGRIVADDAIYCHTRQNDFTLTRHGPCIIV